MLHNAFKNLFKNLQFFLICKNYLIKIMTLLTEYTCFSIKHPWILEDRIGASHTKQISMSIQLLICQYKYTP